MSRWIIGTIGVLSLAGLVGFSGQKASTFVDLPKDEVWEVDFRSSGCFSSSRYVFSFRRAQPLETEVFHFKFNQKTNEDKKISLGKLRLTHAEAAGLDNLFRFYRNKPVGYCTNLDVVDLVRYRAGKEVSREHLQDRTCSYERQDFTRLDTLAARLDKS